MSEIYILTAIATDGPVPGLCSMLSLASAAYQRDKTLVSSFTVNLDTLPGAPGNADRLAWWKSQPEAWAVARHKPEPVGQAMADYDEWIAHLPGLPVFVGHPAAMSYAFVSYYLHRFAGHNPFGRGALDLRTFAMVLLRTPYRQAKRRHMPDEWTRDSPPRTHVVLDDAMAMGTMFCHMLDAWKQLPPAVPAADDPPLRLIDP